MDGSLKVKRRTLIIISGEASSNSNDKIKDNKRVSSNQVTIWEVDDVEVEV